MRPSRRTSSVAPDVERNQEKAARMFRPPLPKVPTRGLAQLLRRAGLLVCSGLVLGFIAPSAGSCAEASDPILDLLLQKGIVTDGEVQKARADAERIRTNLMEMPPIESKWKIGKAIKNIELFGDLRLRYEHRQASTPVNDRLKLDRGRYAVRIGLRGEAFDDFITDCASIQPQTHGLHGSLLEPHQAAFPITARLANLPPLST